MHKPIFVYTEARESCMLVASLPLYSFLVFAVAAASQAPTPAGQNSADQNCTVAGKVSNSLTGEPLKKATVQLMPHGSAMAFGSSGARAMDPPGAKQGYSTTSQADGSFTFENVTPGDYLLLGWRTGYLNAQYGAKRPLSPGTALKLSPGQQKTNVNLPLIPQAVVTGKVMDQDGDPLQGVRVQAIRPRWMQGRMNDMPEASTQTNDLGEFRLASVRPGKCYLEAQTTNFDGMMGGTTPADSGKPEPRPVRTFYPEAISRDAATPLELQAGQDLSGIDIRMHAALTYHVRGKVAGILPEGEGERIMVSVRSQAEQFGFYPANQSMVGKAHTFDIAGVAPGSYDLVLQNMGGKSHLAGRQQIEIGSGDLNDVVLSVQAPVSLKGRIQLEGNPSGKSAAALSNVHVRLSPADSVMMFGSSPSAIPAADGSFTLENVSAGKFMLNTNAPDGAYLISVKFGSQEVRGKSLDVSNGADGEVQIVFRYGAAEVKGTVQDEQHPAPGAETTSAGQTAVTANVVLVPEELNEDGSGLKFNSTAGSGTFSFKQLAPGRYKAYAFEDASFADLQNPAVIKELESKGTDVEVKENDSKQIQLPVISASDFQQVLTKLGLDSAQ